MLDSIKRLGNMIDETDLGTRLVNDLLTQGYLVHIYKIIKSGSVTVTWEKGTDEEAANAALAKFDWSEAAHAAWKVAQQKNVAKTLLVASEPMPIAVKAACYGNMISTQEARLKINEILAALKAGTIQDIQPLVTGDSLESATQLVSNIIDML